MPMFNSLQKVMRPATMLGLLVALLPGVADEALAQVQLRRQLYTEGSQVLRAFRDVSEAVRRSVVEVRCGTETVALGTVVDSDGWILTKGTEITDEAVCFTWDGKKLPATLMARDDSNDLVLLRVDAEGVSLTAIEWDVDRDPEIGQWVITPGTRSLPEAVGVVSTGRRPMPYERIPGVLGIEMEMDQDAPVVKSVFEDGAASEAGVRPGDVILEAGGRNVSSRRELVERVQEHEPGQTMRLKLKRGEEELEVEAVLTHPFGGFLSRIATQNHMGGKLSNRRTGFDAVLQHDTPLKPHECGGPVVTLSGKAFGMNVARAGRVESYALPADVLLPILEKLKSEAMVMTQEEADEELP